MIGGWFASSRAAFDHPIFHKRPDRYYVWQWMVATAAIQTCKQDAGGKTVIVERGQLLTSLKQMQDATGVGIQVIRTLLDRLKNEHSIQLATNTGRMLITICNYNKYQSLEKPPNTAPNTAPNTGLTRDQHAKEQGNKKDTLDTSLRSASKSVKIDAEGFEDFWAVVPRKVAKGTAQKAFVRACKKVPDPEIIIEAMRRYAKSRQGQDQSFTAHPATWLNGERWADDLSMVNGHRADPPKIGDTKTRPDGVELEYQGPMGWAEVHS